MSERALLISADEALIEVVQSCAAAIGLEVRVAIEVPLIRTLWRTAPLVLVGTDAAGSILGLTLARRDRLHVIGCAADQVLNWSVPLGASGLVVPDQVGLLTAILDDRASDQGGAGRLIRVLGGSGGLGTSTLAAGLAVCAAHGGYRSALVELDPFGGGIDILFGAERTPGWRWPDLVTARGHVGDISAQLPSGCGVQLVGTRRPPPAWEPRETAPTGADLPASAVSAVLGSLRRSHELIFVDQGTQPVAEIDVIVVGAEVKAVLAAAAKVSAHALTDAGVVVRTGRGRRLAPELVAEYLGLPLLGWFPDDARLPGAQEVGDPPGRQRNRASRNFGRLLETLLVGSGVAAPTSGVSAAGVTPGSGGRRSARSDSRDAPAVVVDTPSGAAGASRSKPLARMLRWMKAA